MIKKYKSIFIKVLLVIVLITLITIYFLSDSISSVVNLIVVSFIISYAIRPIRDYFCDRFKLSKRISSLIIIFLTVALFGAIVYFIVPTIINESRNFGTMLDSIEEYLIDISNKFNLSDLSLFETAYIQINEKVNLFLSSLSNNLIENIVAILENLVGFAIVPVVSYYFLSDGERIYNKLLLIFPTDKRILIRKINNNIDKVLSRYIVSQLVLSAIIGILTFILLIILRIKSPLMLSILNAIANIIPYFGPIIGGAPIVFIALVQSPSKALLALIGAFIIQQIEGDLLGPKITGVSINLHPILIIILLILGGKIAGIAGMILAVPVVVICKVIYDDINYYLF